MENRNRPIVAGTFRDHTRLDRTVSDLRARGYTDEDFHVVMSDDARKRYYDRDADTVEIEEGSKAMEGAGTGAAIGGTAGGVIGAIAGIGGAIIVPGVGAVAGPIAGALAGAGAGGAAGTLVGALVGAGIPEEHAEMYQKDVEDGGMVLGVNPRTDEDYDYVRGRYDEYGASNVYTSDVYADRTV
jgi:hypothetical protein